MSGSLWPLELKHARLPCPSPSPRACSNSCPLSQWCHPTISSCCPLLLLPSVFPSIRVFSNESGLRIRWPKYWSFSFSIILQMNFQGWFPLGLTGLISLLSKGFSRVFSSTTIWKHQFFSTQLSLWSNSHIHTWLTFPLAIYLTHSAWRIPGTGEPVGLPSMGLHRVGHDWSDLAAAAAYICQCYSFNSSCPLLPPLCPQVHVSGKRQKLQMARQDSPLYRFQRTQLMPWF